MHLLSVVVEQFDAMNVLTQRGVLKDLNKRERKKPKFAEKSAFYISTAIFT